MLKMEINEEKGCINISEWFGSSGMEKTRQQML
jgi:hypothetical protein